MYRGAVFFDIDGTLLSVNEGVLGLTTKTRAAVRALKLGGFLTAIATGRAYSYIDDGLKIFDCYVLANGALCVLGGRVLSEVYFTPAELERLTGYLDGEGIVYALETASRCYCSNPADPAFLRLCASFGFSPSLFSPASAAAGPVNKLMACYQDDGARRRFHAAMGGFAAIADHASGFSSDVGPLCVSKGYGVSRVLERLGIARERTYAFGDAMNDYEMFKAVGTGIAMKRHSPRLDGVAAMVTAGVAEDGIYQALKKLGLI